MTAIRVGTRGSALAIAQTSQVIQALRAIHPEIEFEMITIRTTGDSHASAPFAEVGTKGMFVKEIEEALLGGAINLAVHSLKDLPSKLPPGLSLVATPRRGDARDALVSNEGTLIPGRRQRLPTALPAGAIVGTSSLRRQAQIKAIRPDLEVQGLRGNLDTRLRKLDSGDYDAIVLAAAGLERMGWADRITERIPFQMCVPAPGQGILALEARSEDLQVRNLLEPLNDQNTAIAALAERAFQAELNAGCTVPAGAYASIEQNQLQVVAVIASPDGKEMVRMSQTGSIEEAEEVGRLSARKLLAAGGSRILGH